MNEPLPLDHWGADMTAAIEEIQKLGLEIVEKHNAASDRAAEISDHWRLAERQQEEHDALLRLFHAIQAIMLAVRPALQQNDPAIFSAAAQAIENHIGTIEETFLVIRHAALDLLRWTHRSGHLEGSTLPEQYRASYTQLISYTPMIRPRLVALQSRLLDLARDPDAPAEITQLLSAITRYNGVMDTARGFVRAIVDPPLELVFQETQGALDDWETIPIEQRSLIGTELNDVCQFMLYDEVDFEKAVEHIRPALADGVEASLYCLPVEDWRVLFTVDEDPVFQQLTVTLYRVTPSAAFAPACDAVVQALYAELM